MNVFMKSLYLIGVLMLTSLTGYCQYWQQHVKYDIEVELNVDKHCMDGDQKIVYTNNSPDQIDKAYFHLYFNAFQPGSMMDVRSRTLPDADPRVEDRIFHLTKKEIGYHDIKSFKQDGQKCEFEIDETILVVHLDHPVASGTTTTFELSFESQVPVQIRRSGRDNKEGISYSMSQWYPKLCEYDEDGWHPNPYIGREFYGVWGDFHVSIEIDKNYMVGAGGELINDPSSQKGKKRKWEYRAENVHDFMWAADPDYKRITFTREDQTLLNFYYQPGENTSDNWEKLPGIMDKSFDYINKKYGQYPYPVYSFIQGGDGGMEYPMGTLITGERSLISLVGVCIHELMHSWYQMALGTNESLYPWMDEGFTSYATADVMNYLKMQGLIPGFEPVDDPWASSLTGYRNFATTPFEEPLSTHADHYKRNQAYGIASYVKGSVFLRQLNYIVGQQTFDQIMLDYFNQWKFKHPDVNDFVRVAERQSGMVLDWYKEYWVNTTNKIDYAVDTIMSDGRKKMDIILTKKGDMPMPLDVVVTMEDGSRHAYHIPLRIMRGAKADEGLYDSYEVVEDWPWTNPNYILKVDAKVSDVMKVEIDPSNRMADINLSNNTFYRSDAGN